METIYNLPYYYDISDPPGPPGPPRTVTRNPVPKPILRAPNRTRATAVRDRKPFITMSRTKLKDELLSSSDEEDLDEEETPESPEEVQPEEVQLRFEA